MTRARLFRSIDLAPLHAARLWILLGTLSLLFTWGGYQLGDRYGLLVGFFTSVALICLVLFYSDWRLSNLFVSEQLEGQDPWGVLSITNELASKIGSSVPTVHLVESRTPFAFSAGLFMPATRIYLSQALVERFSPAELRSIIAFELHRLKNEDTKAATGGMAMAGLIAMISNAFDSIVTAPFKRENRQLRPYGPLTLITMPIVAILVRGAVSRRSVLETDKQVAETLGDKLIWAQTMAKLDAYSKTLPLDVNLAEGSLFSVHPLQAHRWTRVAIPQPLVEDRVRALTGRFPL